MRVRAVVTTAALLVFLVSGCSSSPQDMSMGVREAQSAVATARIALTSSGNGDATTTLSRTMVEEAGARLSSASTEASAYQPTDTRTAAQQEAVASALGDADAAIRHAGEALAGYPGAPSVDEAMGELKQAADDLGRLADKLERPR
jgi:inorganic triphosphatase YgiF